MTLLEARTRDVLECGAAALSLSRLLPHLACRPSGTKVSAELLVNVDSRDGLWSEASGKQISTGLGAERMC